MRERSPDPVDTAIRRVLEAERAAEQETARAEALAAERLRAARATALAIGERAERRIARLRAAVDARIARREAEVDAGLRALGAPETGSEAGAARVQRAVALVAAALCGGEPR